MTTPIHESDRPWRLPPGHQGGFSKYLVVPEDGARLIDFRISRYPTGGQVEEHAHEIAEQVYYVTGGEGRMTLDGEEHRLVVGTVVLVAPGVRHALINEGSEDLEFVVVTVPSSDIAR
jgi:quercetin dioxygenase-like cupin family protein